MHMKNLKHFLKRTFLVTFIFLQLKTKQLKNTKADATNKNTHNQHSASDENDKSVIGKESKQKVEDSDFFFRLLVFSSDAEH